MCFFCETDKFLVGRKGSTQSDRLRAYDMQSGNFLNNNSLDEQLVFLYLYSDIIAYHTESDKTPHALGNPWAKFFDNNEVMILALMVHTRLDLLERKIETHLRTILRRQKAGVDCEDLLIALKILKDLIVVLNYWCKNLADGSGLKIKIMNLLAQQIAPSIVELRAIVSDLAVSDGLKEVVDVCNSILSYAISAEGSEHAHSFSTKKKHDALDFCDHLRQTFNLVIGQCKLIQAEAKGLLSEALLAGNHSPQMALYLAFLQLMEYANSAINTIPGRTINYYYKDILKFRRRGVVADSVFANFFIEKKTTPTLIERGTKISAGRGNDNGEIIFFTNENIAVGHASPMACLVIDRDQKIWENNSDDLGIVSRSYFNESSNSSLALADPQKIQERSKLGLIIASSALNLPSGDRSVTVSISLGDSSFEKLEQSLRLRSKEVGQLEMDELSHRLLAVELSTEAGWYGVPKEHMHIVVSNRKKKSIEIILNLPKDAPAVLAMNLTPFLGDKAVALPAIKLSLDSGYLDAFYFFSSLEIEKITIESTVRGYSSLVVQSDLGGLDASKPFNPFGAMPQVGNSLYVDLRQVAYSKAKNLTINIEWANLPTDEGGFESYYDGYAARVANDSFVAALSFMNDSEWEPNATPRQTISIFDYDSGSFLQEKKPIRVDLDRFNVHENFRTSENRVNSKNRLRGFLKLELVGPAMAFGHREYPELLRDVTLKNILAKNKKTPLRVPNRPYTPVIKALSIDYSLKSEINFAQNTLLSQETMLQPRDAVVRLCLFGHENLYPVEMPKPFTILAEGNGLDRCNKIYLGLGGVDTSILTLHLQIDEKTAPDAQDFIAPHWEYLCDNRWVAFSSKEVIADGTRGLIKSGIVKLSTPKTIDVESPIMPKGLFWIRLVNVSSGTTSLAKVLGVHTNAVECTRLVPQGTEDRSDVSLAHLPAGMLKNFLITKTKNIRIQQPYASFGLKPHETEEQLYARARERLRHKNRPTSVWGYERMILERFDEVAMVKCINHSSKNLQSTLAPGHLTIVVVPKVVDNIYPPLASKYLLDSVAEYIEGVASPFITVEVVNPSYEELQVIVELKLRGGCEKGTYIKLVENDLSRLISPWSSFGKTKNFGLDSNIYPSDIFGFLSEKKYIETITKFSLIKKSSSGDEISLTKVNSYNSYIKSTYPWSIVVPAPKHVVSIYEGDFSERAVNTTEACDGIASMSIDTDFVIGPWFGGNRIAVNKTTRLERELEESVETYCVIANNY